MNEILDFVVSGTKKNDYAGFLGFRSGLLVLVTAQGNVNWQAPPMTASKENIIGFATINVSEAETRIVLRNRRKGGTIEADEVGQTEDRFAAESWVTCMNRLYESK